MLFSQAWTCSSRPDCFPRSPSASMSLSRIWSARASRRTYSPSTAALAPSRWRIAASQSALTFTLLARMRSSVSSQTEISSPFSSSRRTLYFFVFSACTRSGST